MFGMSESTGRDGCSAASWQGRSTSRVKAVTYDPLFTAVTQDRSRKRTFSRMQSFSSRDDVSTADVGDIVDHKPCAKKRRSFFLKDSFELKEEALAFKFSHAAKNTRMRGWLHAFIRSKWPTLSESDFKKEKSRIRRLMNRKNFGVEIPRGRPMRGTHETGKRRSHRKRATGGGRVSKASSIDFELWQWFVDTIQNVKGRMPAWLLLAEAEHLAGDLKRWAQREIEQGNLPPDFDLKLPQLDYNWLRRWRAFHHVTWRTVNLTLKCSLVVLKRRLLHLWCNVLRLRWLAYYLLGPSAIIVWINCDQKPL